MGCCPTKLSDGEQCQELDLAEIRDARRSLECETDDLEYKKEQFNIQMEREKQNLKRAHWKLEAKSKLSEDKIELEKFKLSSEKEVLCAKSSDQEAREAHLTKDKKLNLIEMEKIRLTRERSVKNIFDRESAVEKRENLMKRSLAKQDKTGKSMKQEQEVLVKAHIALEDAQTKVTQDNECLHMREKKLCQAMKNVKRERESLRLERADLCKQRKLFAVEKKKSHMGVEKDEEEKED